MTRNLILCLGLLGCTRQPERPDASQTAEAPERPAETQEPYKTYDEAAITQARTDLDALCQEIFISQMTGSFLSLHYSLTDPEAYGINDYEISFGNASLEEAGAYQKELARWKEALNAIDPDLLTGDDKLTWQILEHTLTAEQLPEEMLLYGQNLAPTIGVQAQLPVLLAEYRFDSKKDAEEYLTLLSGIDDYFRQLLEFEKARAKAGLFMSDSCVDSVVSECQSYLFPADYNLMNTTFSERIDAMTELTEEERADLKARNLEIITSDFIPAYELLLEGLENLKGSCVNEMGLCYFEKGREYYEYLVKSGIGPTYDTIEDLKNAVEDRIDADLLAMSALIKENPQVMEEMTSYSFAYTEPEEILKALEDMTAQDFPELPPYSAVCKYVPKELEATLSPAFFLVPPIDDFTDCTIYVNRRLTSDAQPLFTTMAHEGIPGHLYQNVYFLSNCDNNLRRVLSFLGYSEGWASYVENCAYTFEGNGLSPELGKLLALNASASLGLHALMDININYYGWNKDQVTEYLQSFYDVSQPEVVDHIFESMLSSPANYLNYYAGFLEIRNMRDLAEETLKDRFNAKEFHRFLLDMGPAPFSVIEPRFRTWLITYGLK